MDLNELTHSLFLRLATIKTQFVGTRIEFEEMNTALTLSKIKPVIAKNFSFNEVQEAYHYFARGEHMGKVVIRVGL